MRINNILEDKYDGLPDEDQFRSLSQWALEQFRLSSGHILTISYEANGTHYSFAYGPSGNLTGFWGLYVTSHDEGLLPLRMFVEDILNLFGDSEFLKGQLASAAAPLSRAENIHNFEGLIEYLSKPDAIMSKLVFVFWNDLTNRLMREIRNAGGDAIREDRYTDLPDNDKFEDISMERIESLELHDDFKLEITFNNGPVGNDWYRYGRDEYEMENNRYHESLERFFLSMTPSMARDFLTSLFSVMSKDTRFSQGFKECVNTLEDMVGVKFNSFTNLTKYISANVHNTHCSAISTFFSGVELVLRQGFTQ